MKRALLALLALAVALARAADIDNDGFLQDGKTTYCQAVTKEQRPLEFLSLSPSSAGRCPVTIDMDVQARTYSMTESTFDVTWSALLAKTNASLFPGVVNKSTGLPTNIVGAALRACRAGSNCVNSSDVFSAAAQGRDSSIGAFGSTGKRELGSFSFVLPHSTEFTIVGKITLRGVTGAVDFVALQRVKTSSLGRDIPGTVRPRNVTDVKTNKTNTTNTTATPSPQRTSTQQPGLTLGPVGVDAQDDRNSGISSSSSSSPVKNVIIVGVIACIALVGVAVFVVTARFRRQLTDSDLDSDDFDERETNMQFASSPMPNLREQRQAVALQQRVDIHQGEFEMYPAQLYSFAASSEDGTSSRALSESTLASHEDLSVSTVSNGDFPQ